MYKIIFLPGPIGSPVRTGGNDGLLVGFVVFEVNAEVFPGKAVSRVRVDRAAASGAKTRHAAADLESRTTRAAV